jgi:hypothetical protein
MNIKQIKLDAMKIFTRKFKRNSIRVMWLFGFLLAIAMFQSCFTTAYVPAGTTTTVVTREVVPPPWAPPYDDVQQVRYYYLPDVGMYYDVWNHQYIYQSGNQWVFTTTYPAYYSNYDINTAFVVVLSARTIDPWRHHVVYENQYPKYYYRSAYEHTDRYRETNSNGRRYDNSGYNSGEVRGFNENAKAPLYRNPRPTNLGSSRTYTNPGQTNTTNAPVNNNPSDQRRRDEPRNNSGNTYVQPSDNNGRRMDNSQPSNNNYNKSNENQQNSNVRNNNGNADTGRPNQNNNNPAANNNNNRNAGNPNVNNYNNRNNTNTNENNNSNNNAVNKSVETQSRTRPSVNSSREVRQPVRVQKEAQPSKAKSQSKEVKTNSRKEDSKSDDNNSRRR